MTVTTTASVSASNPTIVQNQIIKVLRERNIMLPFITLYNRIGQAGAATVVPRMTATLGATAIVTGAAEGDAQSATEMTADGVTLTAAAKAIHVDMSQFSKAISQVDWDRNLGEQIAMGLSTVMDQDACALMSGGSNSVGATGEDLTIAKLIAAAVKFAEIALEDAPFGVGMLPVVGYGDILRQLSTGTGASLATYFARDDVISWFGKTPGTGLMEMVIGQFMGLPWFRTQNTPLINASADRAGAIFVRNRAPEQPDGAFGMTVTWAPQVRTYDAGVVMKLSDIHQGRVAHGAGELKDEKLVTIVMGAT